MHERLVTGLGEAAFDFTIAIADVNHMSGRIKRVVGIGIYDVLTANN